MRITRQRLKEIILEEMDLIENDTLNVIDTGDEDDSNVYKMGDISESEDWQLTQQVAQILFDTGVTAAQSHQELALVLKGLGKMALLALGGGALGVAGKAGIDAINKIKGTNDATEGDESTIEEDDGDTLTNLITQAIREELD